MSAWCERCAELAAEVARLDAANDELREVRPGRIRALEGRIKELEAHAGAGDWAAWATERIAKLETALRLHGRHASDCARGVSCLTSDCDCGWDALRGELGP